jgi:hypothetical protein
MGSLRHLELLPDDFPSWQAFRDCPSPTTGRQLVKK